jgi:hypothetical protein
MYKISPLSCPPGASGSGWRFSAGLTIRPTVAGAVISPAMVSRSGTARHWSLGKKELNQC